MNNFFTTTFDFEKEKNNFLGYMDLKKSQDVYEFEFHKKYYEIQNDINNKFYIQDLKSRLLKKY